MSAQPPAAAHRLRRCDLPLPLLSAFFTLSLCLMACSSSGVTCRGWGWGVRATGETIAAAARWHWSPMHADVKMCGSHAKHDRIKMPGARQLPAELCVMCCRVLAHQLTPSSLLPWHEVDSSRPAAVGEGVLATHGCLDGKGVVLRQLDVLKGQLVVGPAAGRGSGWCQHLCSPCGCGARCCQLQWTHVLLASIFCVTRAGCMLQWARIH